MGKLPRSEQVCCNCTFFIANESKCKRYPHELTVGENHWCGEWSKTQEGNPG